MTACFFSIRSRILLLTVLKAFFTSMIAMPVYLPPLMLNIGVRKETCMYIVLEACTNSYQQPDCSSEKVLLNGNWLKIPQNDTTITRSAALITRPTTPS